MKIKPALRIIRGGASGLVQELARCTFCGWDVPNCSDNDLGFRLKLEKQKAKSYVARGGSRGSVRGFVRCVYRLGVASTSFYGSLGLRLKLKEQQK